MGAGPRPIEVIVAEAIQRQQTGRLAEADALCREALVLDGRHVDSLHLLGILAHQRGDHAAAIALIGEAIGIGGGFASMHFNIGEAHRALGQLPEAIAAYRRVIEIQPSLAEAHDKLSLTLQALGRFEEAVESYDVAIAARPGDPAIHTNLGLVLARQGKLDEAARRHEAALALNPNFAIAHNNLALVRHRQGRFNDAIAHYSAALGINPAQAQFHHNLGLALQAAKRFEEAAASHRAALAISPGYADAELNLGVALQKLDRLDEAVSHYQAALALDPSLVEGHTNLAVALQAQGRIADAIAACEHAIERRPDFVEAHVVLGINRLLAGDLAQGWPDYEWRLRSGRVAPAPHSSLAWAGEPLDGGAILLTPEQGLGDVIQFVRFAPMVAARGGKVVLSSPPSLTRLLRGAPGVDQIMTRGTAPVEMSRHVSLLSLPVIFRTTLDTIPDGRGYLRADEAIVSTWRERLSGLAGIKIGVNWRGNPNHTNDRNRSMAPAQFARFLDRPGVSLVSLQKDASGDDLGALGPKVLAAGPDLTDFAETAGLIANLDLVITVDTAVGHLAGALGAPVWTLIPFAPDWRWLTDRADSPWYPTMRLFRQPRRGDWESVVEAVSVALEQRVAA